MPYNHLTFQERESIATMKFAGYSNSRIAKELGRHEGTISREIRRNSENESYHASRAQQKSIERRASRPQSRKLDHSPLKNEVRRMISCTFSPDEVSGRLKIEHPDDGRMHVSHQTIYRWLYSNPVEHAELKPFLRHGRYRRRPSGKRRTNIVDRVSIHSRPEEVAQRKRLGDWEGDTIVGKGHRGYVATFVDRRSGFLVAAKMKDHRSVTLNNAARRAFRDVPAELRLTLTVDNGSEFARHKALSGELGMRIYFADPYSSWQRGTNENTNGLLRQFIPKKSNILQLSPTALAFHVERLNNRPRKRLGYLTPTEVFHQQYDLALRM